MLLIFFLVASNQVLLKFNTPILLISKVQCLPSIIWRHLIIFIKNEFLLVGVLICKNSETFMYKSSIAEGAAYLAHLIPIKSNNLLIVLITKYFVIFYVYRLFSKFFLSYVLPSIVYLTLKTSYTKITKAITIKIWLYY